MMPVSSASRKAMKKTGICVSGHIAPSVCLSVCLTDWPASALGYVAQPHSLGKENKSSMFEMRNDASIDQENEKEMRRW